MNREQLKVAEQVVSTIRQNKATGLVHRQPSFIGTGGFPKAPVGETMCGTSACIAGFTAIQVGYEFKFVSEWAGEDDFGDTETSWHLYARHTGKGLDWFSVDLVTEGEFWEDLAFDELGIEWCDLASIIYDMNEESALRKLEKEIDYARTVFEAEDALESADVTS